MSRNAQSRFSKLPDVEISRSKFKRPSTHKTTFNAGKLIPIFCDEVLPGDTFSMTTKSLIRMSTPIFPTMDNAYLDTYFFFVPNRLVWEHWKQFNGENNESYWTQPVEYSVPVLESPDVGYPVDVDPDDLPVGGYEGYGWNKGSIADYFGIPTQVGGLEVNALPFRAYCLIWNEWFRDQNTMSPCQVYFDDSTRRGEKATGTDFATVRLLAHLGADPLPVAKYHDYFTSALPAPQKGPAVTIPFSGNAPVYALNESVPDYPGDAYDLSNMKFVNDGGIPLSSKFYLYNYQGGLQYHANSHTDVGSGDIYYGLRPDNLYAVFGENVAPTINALRQAFQIQKLYEKDARGGTRYTEILKSHFGVDSPDARLQRPEYLGGKRIPINIDQVLQTSQSSDVSPQGNTAGYSLTFDADDSFTKSFTEHGFIIGLACVRTDHTYQQGLEKMWSRKQRFDYYWPALANIGEQAILKKELYAVTPPDVGANVADNDGAFGYQEAWAEYRYKPNRVSGAFRSNYAQTLDAWHYADYYEGGNYDFVVQADWLIETDVNIDRTLAVSSSVEDQFIADFYFDLECTRPMPLYSVPGLIDHH